MQWGIRFPMPGLRIPAFTFGPDKKIQLRLDSRRFSEHYVFRAWRREALKS